MCMNAQQSTVRQRQKYRPIGLSVVLFSSKFFSLTNEHVFNICVFGCTINSCGAIYMARTITGESSVRNVSLKQKLTQHLPKVLSQPAGDVIHKPGGKVPLLSARPAVTFATLKKAATSFAA